MWRTSPFEAVEFLRSTVETLRAAGSPFPNPLRKVDVPPFGKFDGTDAYGVHKHLFRCEFALGRYEEALQVSTSLGSQIPETILEQVDCLMAMGRRADAVALLEKNLTLDNWRGPLRRRLEELSGKPGAGVN
jgi:tetratricopeptide (TPR) repeat protein